MQSYAQNSDQPSDRDVARTIAVAVRKGFILPSL